MSDAEINAINAKSKLVAKYNQDIDSLSAYEILNQKLAEAQAITAERVAEQEQEKQSQSAPSAAETFFDNPIVKQVGRTAASIITRSLLGALGLGGRSGSGRTSRRR